MKKMVQGEITIFLSLIFLLLLSLVGATIESASIQVLKNEKRAMAGRAMESTFAEYQTNLLKRYDIFALEGSYETGNWSEQNILNRLSFYGAENIDSDISKIQFLSDQNGQPFYEQAVEYEKQKYGMGILDKIAGKFASWKGRVESSKQSEGENDNLSEELDRKLEEAGGIFSEEDNPIGAVSKIKKSEILGMVLPKDFSLSEKAINLSDTPEKRKLKKGQGVFEDTKGHVPSSIFFNLYLRDKFQCASDKEDRALCYELEYLLAGKSSDAENLKTVVNRIVKLRFGISYAYLLTDSAKVAEAEALAAAMCTALMIPEFTQVVKQALLLAWAYGEGVMDMRSLLAGKKVAIIKTKDTWQLSLGSLLTLTAGTDIGQEKDMEGGYDYRTYLQMMLLSEEKSTLSMRALTLIECNMRQTEGLSFFRVDSCVTKLEVHNICPMRRGIEYRFNTRFLYQ